MRIVFFIFFICPADFFQILFRLAVGNLRQRFPVRRERRVREPAAHRPLPCVICGQRRSFVRKVVEEIAQIPASEIQIVLRAEEIVRFDPPAGRDIFRRRLPGGADFDRGDSAGAQNRLPGAL